MRFLLRTVAGRSRRSKTLYSPVSGRRGQGGHAATHASNGEDPNADVHASGSRASGDRSRNDRASDGRANDGDDGRPNAGVLR